MAIVTGRMEGAGPGALVTAYTRTKRGVPYTEGSTVMVNANGTFRWTRAISSRKTLWVYFTADGVKSNILRLTP